MSIKESAASNQLLSQVDKSFDPILIANELLDDFVASLQDGCVFKLDFEKAYDMVDWDFLLQVLKCKDFGARWIG